MPSYFLMALILINELFVLLIKQLLANKENTKVYEIFLLSCLKNEKAYSLQFSIAQ